MLANLQASGYSFESRIAGWLNAAGDELSQAVNLYQAGSEAASAVHAYQVLTNVIQAREAMVLQQAGQDIEKNRKGNLQVNLTGTYNVTKAVFAGMRERKWGRVICMASIAGLNGVCTKENEPIYFSPSIAAQEPDPLPWLVECMAHEIYHEMQPFGQVPDTMFEEFSAYYLSTREFAGGSTFSGGFFCS